MLSVLLDLTRGDTPERGSRFAADRPNQSPRIPAILTSKASRIQPAPDFNSIKLCFGPHPRSVSLIPLHFRSCLFIHLLLPLWSSVFPLFLLLCAVTAFRMYRSVSMDNRPVSTDNIHCLFSCACIELAPSPGLPARAYTQNCSLDDLSN